MEGVNSVTNRVVECSFQVSIGLALFASVWLVDPLAHQSFREPKMVALVWLSGALLLLWGIGNVLRVLKGRPPLWPPRQYLSLLPLVAVLAIHLWVDFQLPQDVRRPTGILPTGASYHLHIMLPALSWFVLAAGCANFFRTLASRDRLALLILVALAIETFVVSAEVVEGYTGLSVNPVGWLGQIDVGETVVKKRIFGTIGNPNFVAGYLAIASLPLLGWTLSRQTLLGRSVGAGVLLPTLVLLVSTRSKGGLLALGTGLCHFLVANWLSRRRNGVPWFSLRRSSIPVVAAVLLVAILVAGTGWLLAEKTANPAEEAYLKRWVETLTLRGDSIAVRALLAHCGFRMWEEKPVGGLGPGGFKVNFLESLRNLLENDDTGNIESRITRLHSLRANHVHNEYLQALIEWGVVGFAFLQLFLVWCQLEAFQYIRTSQTRRDAWLRLGFLSGVWSGLGGCLFDLPLHRPAQAFLMAVLLGASLSPVAGAVRMPRPTFRTWAAGLPATAGIVLLGLWMIPEAVARYSTLHAVFWGNLVVEGRIPGADLDKAGSAIRTAVRRVPGEGDYAYLLAEYELFVEDDPNGAIRQIREARLNCDQPGLYLLEARAQIQRNDFRAAEPNLAFFESLDRDSPGFHFLKGRVHESRGRWREACSEYRSEIEISQGRHRPVTQDLKTSYFHLARILEEQLGEYSQAAEDYEELSKIEAKEGQEDPEVFIRLGVMYRDRFHDPRRAEELLGAALESFARRGLVSQVERVRNEIEKIRDR